MTGCKAFKQSTLGIFPRVLCFFLLPFWLPMTNFCIVRGCTFSGSPCILLYLQIADCRFKD